MICIYQCWVQQAMHTIKTLYFSQYYKFSFDAIYHCWVESEASLIYMQMEMFNVNKHLLSFLSYALYIQMLGSASYVYN